MAKKDYLSLSGLSTLVSEIKNLLSTKQNTITGGATTIASSNLTSDKALISSGSGKVAASSISSTELECLADVKTNVQVQLDNKIQIITWGADD